MADIADQADTVQQQFLEEALAVRSNHVMRPKQSCHNCDEPLSDNSLFCDSECRDDYTYREQRQK